MRMAVCFLGLLNKVLSSGEIHHLYVMDRRNWIMDRRNWIMDQRFIL